MLVDAARAAVDPAVGEGLIDDDVVRDRGPAAGLLPGDEPDAGAGAVVGVEALMRWEDPLRGQVQPARR